MVCVKIRNVEGHGWAQKMMNATTLHALKEQVVEALQESWNDINFTLSAENIRVFQHDGDDGLNPLLSSDHALSTDSTYIAVEYFETIPTDMYRTVGVHQLQPSIYIHPDQLDETGRWTKISPLYCAAMKKDNEEMKFPWFSVSKQGIFVAHGTSLFCKDTTQNCSSKYNPFNPIREDEKKGMHTRMSLEQYGELVGEGNMHPIFGILHTDLSHEDACHFLSSERAEHSRIEPSKEKNKERKKQGTELLPSRLVCFRYKLKAGVNLAPYGMAVVYDNSSQFHCSLIRKNEINEIFRRWTHIDQISTVFVPVDIVDQFRANSLSDEHSKNHLLRQCLAPFEPQMEPEVIGVKLAAKNCVVFPKVAALFVLHDLTMKASAEPVPPDKFDNLSQKSIYQAALVLYYVNTNDNVQRAIEELENANYSAENIESHFCMILLQALQGFHASAFDEKDITALELDLELDLQEAILDGIGVLNGILQESLPAKTPMPPNIGCQEKCSPDSVETSGTSVTQPHSEISDEPPVEVVKSSSGDTNVSDVQNVDV